MSNQSYIIKDYGLIGDSTTDNTHSFGLVISEANAYWIETGKQPTIYLPSGIFVTSSVNCRYEAIKIEGVGIGDTTIDYIGHADDSISCNYENITLKNLPNTDLYVTSGLKFKNVEFLWTTGTGYTYINNWGFYNHIDRIEYDNCIFRYNQIFLAIQAYNNGVGSVIIKNCTFTGTSSYCIYITRCDNALIDGNTVSGGTAGIFFGSQRQSPIENVIISNNIVHGQSEEGISCDAFGNNKDLCPTIGNGEITYVNNDGDGNLVLSTILRYAVNNEGIKGTMVISERDDWTNFYYCFYSGALAGTYYKILSFDAENNRLTIDCKVDKSVINIDDVASIDAGFHNFVIANNTIYDCGLTGISIYMDCFDFDVYGNTVCNCLRGGYAIGGLSLDVWIAKAWNINVHNNEFIDCIEYGFSFTSWYTTAIDNFGNILRNNIFTHAASVNAHQVNFTNEGNIMNP